MESWIEFGRGPLFRLSFVLMLLGLMRILMVAFVNGMKTSMASARDFQVDELPAMAEQLGIIVSPNIRKPFEWLIDSLFHLIVIIVPLFVAAHVIQWKHGVGFAWWQLPQGTADKMTLAVIFAAPILAAIRLWRPRSGLKSRTYFRPLFIAIPFVTGYICVNGAVSPTAYYTSMLIHVWAGNLLMLAVGFTSLADSVISPFVRFSAKSGSRFGRMADPVWVALVGRSDRS